MVVHLDTTLYDTIIKEVHVVLYHKCLIIRRSNRTLL